MLRKLRKRIEPVFARLSFGVASKAEARREDPLRILLLGAESSGKTTLATALAAHYQAFWVPEYFRFYWDAKRLSVEDPRWQSDEFLHIAGMQNQFEDYYAQRTRRLLICDTDAFALSVWHYRYLGFYAPAMEALWRKRRRDLVFLCLSDIPFVQDGVRDGEAIRQEMLVWLRDRLFEARIPYIELSGRHEDRLKQALAKIDAILD